MRKARHKASASSYRHFSNDAEGFSGLLSWLTSETGFKTGALVVGMENTGLYGYALCRFLERERVDYCVFNPLALKKGPWGSSAARTTGLTPSA